MLSTCPTCLTQVNHADHLMDVTCECGAHFSPYFNPENSGGFQPQGTTSFAESTNAFKEIVQFGEGLDDAIDMPMQPQMATELPKKKAAKAEPTEVAGEELQSFQPVFSDQSIIIVNSPHITGYNIEQYFSPVSVLCEIESGAGNVLQAGFQALTQLAQSLNASGIIGLEITALDSSKVLLTGTPVQCQKS